WDAVPRSLVPPTSSNCLAAGVVTLGARYVPASRGNMLRFGGKYAARGTCAPAGSARARPPRSEPLGRPVAAPDLPQGVAHLADRGPGAQRLAHRVEHVLTAGRGPAQVVQARGHLGAVAGGPQLRQAPRL